MELKSQFLNGMRDLSGQNILGGICFHQSVQEFFVAEDTHQLLDVVQVLVGVAGGQGEEQLCDLLFASSSQPKLTSSFTRMKPMPVLWTPEAFS